MNVYSLFSATQLNVDPKITQIFLWFFILLIITVIIMTGWQFLKDRNTRHKEELEVQKIVQEKELKARKHVTFDKSKSVLIRGSLTAEIPRDTLEYYVCKEVFSVPTELHRDSVILESARMDDDAERPIYQAMRRINEKAKKSLKVDDGLLQRIKFQTILNKKYL